MDDDNNDYSVILLLPIGPQGPTQKVYIDTAYSKVLSKGILVMK